MVLVSTHVIKMYIAKYIKGNTKANRSLDSMIFIIFTLCMSQIYLLTVIINDEKKTCILLR